MNSVFSPRFNTSVRSRCLNGRTQQSREILCLLRLLATHFAMQCLTHFFALRLKESPCKCGRCFSRHQCLDGQCRRSSGQVDRWLGQGRNSSAIRWLRRTQQRLALDLAGRRREEVATLWLKKLSEVIREVDPCHMIAEGVIPLALYLGNTKPLFHGSEVHGPLGFVSAHSIADNRR